MAEGLRNAGNILKSALAQYLDASLTIRREHDFGHAPDSHFDMALDELEQIDSYESTIGQCRRMLSKLRNSRPALVPASVLPPELLSHIFALTNPTYCETFLGNRENAPSNRSSWSPESLLSTCSYWRSIALDSPVLWTHIDLAPFTPNSLELIYTGKRCAARSGESALYIHIDLIEPTRPPQPDQVFLSFWESVVKRAKSVELEYANSFGPEQTAILEKLIANCTPGKLSRFAMFMLGDSDNHVPGGFITANDSDFEEPDAVHRPLKVSHDHFDKVFGDVTALTLAGIYPWWTSRAYHGLTKLHISESSGYLLPISRIASVLRASPQLRYFFIGTAIVEDVQPDSICLNDLEVFEVQVAHSQHDAILRLVLPSSKPLRFYTGFFKFDVNLSTGIVTGGEYRELFSRSNMVQLEATWSSGSTNVTLNLCELLTILPKLKVLSLDGFDLELPLNDTTSAEPVSGSQLAELRLANSAIDPNVFRWVINSYPTVRIRIEEPTCSVRYNGYDSMERWKEVLTGMYPTVQFIQDVSLLYDIWQ